MKILARVKSEKLWKLVESLPYEDEGELQQLLAESPSLISIEDVREGAGQLVVAVREFPLPLIGYVDLLGFSAEGDLTLIECKLASNPQIKREVVGQALEYGGQLWQMSYEDLNEKVQQRSGRPLAELMKEALGGIPWDEEAFRARVESSLAAGSFILMIVVDQVTDELSRIIQFVNNCGQPAFSFAALEMQRFQSDQTDMLIPRVVGNPRIGTSNNQSSRKRWTWDAFLEDAKVRCDPITLKLMNDLFEWSGTNGKVRFGTGSDSGSFTLIHERDGKSGSIFSVFSRGHITVNFGYMLKTYSEQETEEFKNVLATIHPFSQLRAFKGYYFSLKVSDAFLNPVHMEAFKKAILELKESKNATS